MNVVLGFLISIWMLLPRTNYSFECLFVIFFNLILLFKSLIESCKFRFLFLPLLSFSNLGNSVFSSSDLWNEEKLSWLILEMSYMNMPFFNYFILSFWILKFLLAIWFNSRWSSFFIIDLDSRNFCKFLEYRSFLYCWFWRLFISVSSADWPLVLLYSCFILINFLLCNCLRKYPRSLNLKFCQS